MRRLSLLFILASMLLAACGGEDKPSRAEFAADANKICQDLEKTGETLKEPESVEEIEKYATDLEKEVDEAVSRLDELETPEGDDGEKAQNFIDEIKKGTDDQIKPALNELRDAAQAKDEKAIIAAAEKIQKVDTPEADKLANELGAKECAN
jgi:hypothetical protein